MKVTCDQAFFFLSFFLVLLLLFLFSREGDEKSLHWVPSVFRCFRRDA